MIRGGFNLKRGWRFSVCLGLSLLILTMILPVQTVFAATAGTPKSTPITRLAGSDRYETAVKISQAGWADHSSSFAVLAAGMNNNLVDALTSAPLAKMKNAPILLTQGDQLNAFTKAELQRLGVTTVYVTSGLGVITQPVINELQAMQITVIPLGGADRFATALNIAGVVGFPGKLVIASASGNADALSIAAIAAEQGMPILLTYPDKIPQGVTAYLHNLPSPIEQTYVIGGTSVINENVAKSLTNTLRIGGTDRYDTNKLVIGAFSLTFSAEKDVIYLANGGNAHLVDSLTGSMLAAKDGTAILLTPEQMPDTTRQFLKDMFPLKGMVAFGGDSLVPQADLEQLGAYTAYTENGTTVGSDSAPSAQFADNVQISGNNATVQNADFSDNLYITGNNVQLSNIKVAGAVILEPSDGTAVFNNVQAKSVILNTGATGSVAFNDVQADILESQNKVPVNVTLKGTTKFQYSVIMSDTKLDTGDGAATFGSVMILSVPALDGSTANLAVQLAGIFEEPLLLASGATITALPEAVVDAIQIAPTNQNNKVTLQGQIGQVDVLRKAQLELAADSSVNGLTIYADTHVTVAKTAAIHQVTKENDAVLTLDGEGASNVGDATQT
jgi:putative cell wall-binding protein